METRKQIRVLRPVAFALCCVFSAAGCAAWQTSIPTERLRLELPSTGGWYEERLEASAAAVITVCYPAADDSANWDQRVIESAVFGAQKVLPARQMMEMGKLRQERRCAEVVWRVLREDAGDILYEWSRALGCHGRGPQHEIGRYVAGDEAMHHVIYVAETRALSEQRREAWIRRIEAATLSR